MPGVLASLAPLLSGYGYLAIGGLLFAENLGAPVVPGETMLIAGAVYAGAGRLNVVAVGLIALVTAIAGSNAGYAIGRFGGRRLVVRYGRYVLLTESRLDRLERFFTRRGGPIIALARFIEGLRQAGGIIAGISGMPWPEFFAYNAIGAVVWVGTWTSLGYLAGDHIGAIYAGITRYSLYAVVAAGVAVGAVIAWHVLRRRRERREGHERSAAQAGKGTPAADRGAGQ